MVLKTLSQAAPLRFWQCSAIPHWCWDWWQMSGNNGVQSKHNNVTSCPRPNHPANVVNNPESRLQFRRFSFHQEFLCWRPLFMWGAFTIVRSPSGKLLEFHKLRPWLARDVFVVKLLFYVPTDIEHNRPDSCLNASNQNNFVFVCVHQSLSVPN